MTKQTVIISVVTSVWTVQTICVLLSAVIYTVAPHWVFWATFPVYFFVGYLYRKGSDRFVKWYVTHQPRTAKE